jgi:hypothetical protein
MVKSAESRQAKITAKIDPTAIGLRLVAMQVQQTANSVTAQSQGYDVATNVRDILNQYSVSSNFASTFQAFGNELASKARKFTGLAFAKEGGLVLAKWKLRCTISGSIPADFVLILTAICTKYGIVYA